MALIYRSTALRSLRPWEQALIVCRAKRERARHMPSILLTAALGGLVFGLLMWFGDKPIPAAVLWPVMAISIGITHLAIRWQVRMSAARMAAQVLEQRAESDGPMPR